MGSQLPVVSVIIPAYNAEAFIGQTLDSVLSQTYKNIEVIVVDDGSRDRTTEIVESIAQKDTRVILVRQQNAGVAAARNLAIQKSSGEYIAPMDADDIWFPQKLEKQVQCILEAEPSVGLVYAWTVDIDEKGALIDGYVAYNLEGWIYTALVYVNFVGNASVPLIRRTCFKKVGGYNCKLKEQNAQGCEDLDLYLRIAEYYQFRVVPEFLICYRQTMGSMASNFTSMASSYHLVMEDVRQRHPEISNKLFKWSNSCFYNYLSGKSRACGDHRNTLIWLHKALQFDLALLLCLDIYKVLAMSIVKIVAQPVTCLIWQDHRSWLQFRRRFRSNERVIAISEIKGQIMQTYEGQRVSRTPYGRILLQRWCQAINDSLPLSHNMQENMQVISK